MPKVTPFLWFDDQAEEAAELYVSVFNGRPGSSGDSEILLMLATLLAKMKGTATLIKPLLSRTSDRRSPEMSPLMIWSFT